MGYTPTPNVQIFKKWAYFPIRSTSGKWIFRKEYVVRKAFDYVYGGKTKTVFTKNEWTVWLLKNPPKQNAPPSGASGLPKRTKSVVKKPAP